MSAFASPSARVAPCRGCCAYFGRYKGRAVLALLGMVVVSAATVSLLFLVQKVVDEVLGAGTAAAVTGAAAAAGSRRLAPLLRWLEGAYDAALAASVAAGLGPRFAVPILLLAALVVKNVFAYLSEFALNSIGLAMVRDLRRDAYRALLDQSSRFSAETSSGDLMSRILTDAEQIQVAFGSRLADFVQGCLTMLLVLLYVFSLHFRLALAVLVVTPLLVGPIVGNFRQAAAGHPRGPASASARWARSSGRPSAATGSSRRTRWRTSRRSASAGSTAATSTRRVRRSASRPSTRP